MKIEEIKHEKLCFCYRFHIDENTTMLSIIRDLEVLEIPTGSGVRFLTLYDDNGFPKAVNFYQLEK